MFPEFHGYRIVWTAEDGTVLDWHRELIENHIRPATNMDEDVPNDLPKAVYAREDDEGWPILYGLWDSTLIYLCNPGGMSEDLLDSLTKDSLKQ